MHPAAGFFRVDRACHRHGDPAAHQRRRLDPSPTDTLIDLMARYRLRNQIPLVSQSGSMCTPSSVCKIPQPSRSDCRRAGASAFQSQLWSNQVRRLSIFFRLETAMPAIPSCGSHERVGPEVECCPLKYISQSQSKKSSNRPVEPAEYARPATNCIAILNTSRPQWFVYDVHLFCTFRVKPCKHFHSLRRARIWRMPCAVLKQGMSLC
jgi:hypothetical protein